MFEDLAALPTIEAERVLVRALRPSDDAALFEVFSEPEITRFLVRPPMTALAQATALREDIERHFAARTLFQWGVAQRSDDALIGTVTLLNLALDHGRAEIGFVLGRKSWGHGLMREAVRATIAYLFEAHALRRIEADVDPRNARSLALLEGLGFAREGLLRARYLAAGELQDTVMLGLLRTDPLAPRAMR